MSLSVIQRGIDEDLVLHIPLVEGAGSSAFDRSPEDNNGTITFGGGGEGTFWANMKDGLPVGTFDGAADYVDCGGDASLDVTTDKVSFAAWINTDTIADPEWQHILSKGNDEQYQMRIGAGGGLVYWEITTGAGGVTVNTPSAIAASTWYHFVGTFDGAFLRLYQDGQLIADPVAQTGNIVSSGDTLKIGVRDGGYGEFDGKLCDIRLYSDRVLTEQEIRYLAGMRRRV